MLMMRITKGPLVPVLTNLRYTYQSEIQ